MRKTSFVCNPLFVVVLISFFYTNCTKPNKQSDNTLQVVPEDFSIRFGEGGGFTGLWQGYTIQADGTIFTWQGRMAGKNPKPFGKLSIQQVKSLWREIQKTGFFSQQSNRKGNMTSVIRVTANNKSHDVSWTTDIGEAVVATNSLRQLQQFCRDLVEKSKK